MGVKATKIQIKVASWCDKSKRFLYNKRISMSRSGYPDIEIYDQQTGITWNFEVKAEGDSLDALQILRLKQFNKNFTRAFELTGFEEFLELIGEIKSGKLD